MFQVFPVVRDIGVDELYADVPRGRSRHRPWIISSMIASIDGAISIDGTSGGLGNSTDRTIFRRLREIADGVLVGGETVRRESYKPLPRHQALAVFSRSGNLGVHSEALRSAGNTITVEGDPAQFTSNLTGDVWILEGGPTLNGLMFAAECVDEICLTISPRLVAGTTQRMASGPDVASPSWTLAHIAHDKGFVFLRYLRTSAD